ncbi:PREDICTED: dual specificity protein phosphatase 22-A-like [Pygoscelis adeliae]|uniref:dual specificity protein phosphatase 22-A-like n=1 Tax=Pygoscelis adeliae TaxID=9238 RepID=UPI0004F4F06C|nr:PREDICTED: dual specificity protein phosphatase 22-A-like [Pygoscelis adeliae]
MGSGMSKVVKGLYLGNIRAPVVGIPHPEAAPSPRASLAGVSRSTTVLVAYLMTVTELGWEGCLAATKAVRSYVSPNFGFQQQLQEYEVTLLQEYRAWIHRNYGRNPFKDQEELQRLLARQEQRQKEQQLGSRESSWLGSPAPTYPLPDHAGGTSRSRWMNR